MNENSSFSRFRASVFNSLLLSILLLFICLLIIFFVPVNEESIAVLEDESVGIQEQKNVALEIACTANFLTNCADVNNFVTTLDTYYLKDFLNYELGTSGDKGLDLYRNPQTRGAVELFFIRVTGKRDVTSAILKAADRENIPLTLAFALAYTESRFKSTAINHNVNGSIDRGLFQLNDRSFPQLEEVDFFSPSVSAQYGMRHLRFCRGIAKDDLVAVAMYNAGVTRVKNNQTPKSTLAYVSNIAKYKSKLDVDFEHDVVSMFEDSIFYVDEEKNIN